MSENNETVTININVSEGKASNSSSLLNYPYLSFPWPGGWSPIPICFPTPPDFKSSGDFFSQGKIHNLVLKSLMTGLPSVDLGIKEAQEIFKEKLMIMNDELALGYDTNVLKKLNFIPPAKRKFVDHMIYLFESSEMGKDKVLSEAIQRLMKKGEEHRDDLTAVADYAKELHSEFISKVKNPTVLTNTMSVAYASATLYANPDNAGKLLGVSGSSKVIADIDWDKVVMCDLLGACIGPEGAAVASACSIVNQS